jgi:hypothetical protein
VIVPTHNINQLIFEAFSKHLLIPKPHVAEQIFQKDLNQKINPQLANTLLHSNPIYNSNIKPFQEYNQNLIYKLFFKNEKKRDVSGPTLC